MTSIDIDQIEHEEFMAEIHALRAKIYSGWLEQNSASQMNSELTDIKVYGTEPIFAGMVFDALLASAPWL